MNKLKKVAIYLCVLLLIATSIHPINASGIGTDADNNNSGNVTVEKAKPSLQILSTETYRVYSQKENTIQFHINNTSRFTATSVSVKPDLSADKAVPGVRLLSTVLEPNNHSISPDSRKQFELKMIVDDSAKEGIYPVYLNVSYKNNSGDSFQTTLILYYEVRKDSTKLEKVEITEENFASLKPVADSELALSYRIKNEADYQIRNVKSRIEGLPAEFFTLMSGSEVAQVGNIMPLIAKEVEFKYYIKEGIAAGSYPFTVVFEYENRDGQRIVRQAKYNIFVPATTSSKQKGKLTYSAFSYPSSVAQDQTFQVSFKITNSGEKDVKDLVVKFADNPVFLPKTSSIVKYDEFKQGETKSYSISVIGTGDGLKDRNYPMTFEVSYRNSDAKDAAPVVDTQIIGVYLDAKEEKSKDKEAEKNVPKIILNSYLLEPNIVQAGQEFDLEMEFKNTNQTRDIYNVKAYLTFDIATGTNTVQQNVFAPVNSSNTFYINQIGSNQVVKQKLRMYVVPDAEPKSYTVTVNFEYEDKDGKQISSKELVGIPVKQTTKVETSDLTIPTEATLGSEVSANFNLYNTGKAKVYNLIINTQGNFTAEPNSQYIGNFEVGNSNSYEGYLRFTEPGEQKGKFIISYEDQSGQKFTIEKEFTVMVQEDLPMPDNFDPNVVPGGPEMPQEGSGLPILPIVIGIVAVIVVGLIVLGILRKRKHKKEMSSYEEK